MAKASGGGGRIRVMSESEYLGSKGLNGTFSDSGLHISNSSISAASRKRMLKSSLATSQAYEAKQEEARAEYQSLVSAGRMRSPTRIERLRKAARGHPDLESTQAARRLLAKNTR